MSLFPSRTSSDRRTTRLLPAAVLCLQMTLACLAAPAPAVADEVSLQISRELARQFAYSQEQLQACSPANR